VHSSDKFEALPFQSSILPMSPAIAIQLIFRVIRYMKREKINWALVVICGLLLEYDDDPIRILAGKPECWDAKRTYVF
jgi:hypothetical protein